MNAPVPVLVIEDNPGDARFIRDLLRDAPGAAFEVECVARLGAGLERLAARPFAAVLLSLALPDRGGLETFIAVRSRTGDTPIIVLTGAGDQALALNVVQEGGQDYLVKGEVNGESLARAIHDGIERQRIAGALRGAHASLQQYAQELEDRVARQAAELKERNAELETFTYSVSHDLRAPLRHVSSFVRLLIEDFGAGMEPKARHYLQRIEDGAQHMGRLVDDLLALARLGRQMPHVQPTALGRVVQEVIAELTPDLAGRHIEWRVATLPEVACDPGLMRAVFTNLLSNAVKYTRPRNHAVIEVGEATEAGERRFFVKDNGVGFDMKYADKLFGVFQRLHHADEFEGTGVGLATVQRIIHKHGGRIWADAVLNGGATFYFTLSAVGDGRDRRD